MLSVQTLFKQHPHVNSPTMDARPRFRLNSIASTFSRRSSVDSMTTLCDGAGKSSFGYDSPPAMPPPSYETAVAGQPIHDSSFSSKLRKFPVWKRRDSAAVSVPPKSVPTQHGPIDTKSVQDAMKLMEIAMAMRETQPRMAADLYLMAIDKLIAATPADSEAQLQTVLEQKLDEIKKQNGCQEQPAAESKPTTFSDRLVNAAVYGAIALKKSPIPDAVASAMAYAKSSFDAVDETYHIRQKTLKVVAKGLDKALDLDRQYNIHQKVTDAVYTGVTAFVKASIAYAETPARPAENTQRC